MTHIAKQRYTLLWIYGYRLHHGRSPTRAELGECFGINPKSAHKRLLTLKKHGLITTEPFTPRSVRLTELGMKMIDVIR